MFWNLVITIVDQVEISRNSRSMYWFLCKFSLQQVWRMVKKLKSSKMEQNGLSVRKKRQASVERPTNGMNIKLQSNSNMIIWNICTSTSLSTMLHCRIHYSFLKKKKKTWRGLYYPTALPIGKKTSSSGWENRWNPLRTYGDTQKLLIGTHSFYMLYLF